jgi:hypothetical protein
MLARTIRYTGTSCGVEVSRSAQLSVLGHLHGHRAGAKRQKWQRGSRVVRGRARAVLSRFVLAVRALAATASKNETTPVATRIDHQLPQDLIPNNPKPADRRGEQASELSTIVAVDHQKYPFLS